MIPNHHHLLDQRTNFEIHVFGPTTALSSLVSPRLYPLHPDTHLIAILVARPTLYSSAEEVCSYGLLVVDQQAMKVSGVIV